MENVWFGVSVVDVRSMLTVARTMAKDVTNIFWSVEPLLEEVSLKDVSEVSYPHWIIDGGESGPNRRPFDPAWARKLRDESQALNIPFFMKQIDKVKEIPEDLMIREFPIGMKAPSYA